MKAAVIGLGSMGFGAARSLIRAGIDTAGCDVDEAALSRLASAGGTPAETPAKAVAGAAVVLIFLVNARQAQSVLFGSREGAVGAAALGTVFVLNTTMAPDEAESLAADLVAAGMQAIDAPVSGDSAKSAAGELTLMASGAPAAFEAAGPVLEAMSARIFRLGDTPGIGSKVKMINQLLAGVHIAAMAEAMVLARRAGLDLATVYEVILQSAGNSWMFERRGRQVVEGDYTPHSAVDIFVKDLGIVTDAAGDADLPLARAAEALFKAAAETGLGGEADAAVAKILATRAALTLPGAPP